MTGTDSPRKGVVKGLGSAVATWTILMALQAGPLDAQEVTFARDVAPILSENCVQCHRPGSFAPMSLLT
jgi:hypothetical protein